MYAKYISKNICNIAYSLGQLQVSLLEECYY